MQSVSRLLDFVLLLLSPLLLLFDDVSQKRAEEEEEAKNGAKKFKIFISPKGKKSAKLYVFSSPSKEHLDDDDHVLPSAQRRPQVWHRASGDVFFFVWDDGPTFGILDDGTHAAWSRVVVVVVDQRENDFEARRTRANVRVRGEESAERAASGTRTEHGLRSGKCAGEGETHTHTHTHTHREHFVIEKHFDLFFFFLSFWEIFSSSVERERERERERTSHDDSTRTSSFYALTNVYSSPSFDGFLLNTEKSSRTCSRGNRLHFR